MEHKLLIYTLISIFFTTILFGVLVKDNSSTLDELKLSSKNIIEKNQNLFNKNKDGSTIDKKFNGEKFASDSYSLYKKMTSGKSLKGNDLKNSNDYKQLSEALTTYLAAARIIVAKNQKLINTDKDGKANPKNFYPAVFGRYASYEFKKRSGIVMKQTTLGKGGYGARNSKYNSPDSWETKALNKFESSSWKRGEGFGEEVSESGSKYYRYMKPLEIKQACLGCHGDPKGEKDISGHIKEGYKLNDIRGGISVKIPMK